MIVGITGTNCAGKGTVAEVLKAKGFKYFSVRDFLSDILREKGLMVDRSNMILMANQLRSKYGPSYIVEELYKKAVAQGGDAVIESIRAVGEVEALRKKGHFVLFAIDADPEVRYSRIIERGENHEFSSFEDFLQQEEIELTSTDATKQNLRKCIEMADHLFMNEWSMEELQKKVSGVLGNRGPGIEHYVRPSWDEYFMEIAHAVARRGTCDRGRTAAVIVKDRIILVTGYVGSPIGIPHCDDVGHQMKEMLHEDKSISKHCVRTNHAEVNAVALAAKKGISIDGATIYMKMSPCHTCSKMLINAGIKRVVCSNLYHKTNDGIKLLEQAGIKVEVLNNEVERYEGQ
jgi:dCMP deaminase